MNILYFFSLHLFLFHKLSLQHTILSILVSLSIVLLLDLNKKTYWQIGCFFFLFGVYFYGLLNVAYFKFFGHFVDSSTLNDFALTANYLSFITEYLYLVPTWIYAITLFLLGILIFLFFQLGKQSTNSLILAGNKKSIRVFKLVFVQIIILSITIFNIALPRSSWWNAEHKSFDQGILGHGYEEVLSFLKTERQDLFQAQIAEGKERTEIIDELIESNTQRQALATATKENVIPAFEEQPNILVITLESIPTWPLKNSETPMPFLKHLIDTNVRVKQFFPNSCQTINAEFSTLCSLWPESTGAISEMATENEYYCLPHILKDHYGYNTYYMHANDPTFWSRNTFMPKLGFDFTQFAPPFSVRQYDGTVFTESIDIMRHSNKPFFGMIMGFTSHTPHNEEVMQANWEISEVVITPFDGMLDMQLVADSNLTEKRMQDYFGFLTSVDDGLKMAFDHLRQSGLLNNTIVIITDDHRSYGFSSEDELKNFYLYNETPFVMVLPEHMNAELQPIASHIDIAPTILDMLGEQKYKEKYNFLGKSLFANDFVPEVLNKCLGTVYYKNEQILLQGSAENGLYEVLETSYETHMQEYYKEYIAQVVAQTDALIR